MTPTDTPAAQAAAGDVWRVVLADGDVGVCVPRDCEDGSWSAVVRWPGGAMSRADGSDAGQAVWRAAVERCEWLYGRDDVAAYVVEVLAPGESPRAELAHRAEQGAVDTARIDRALATIDALTRERDRLTADLARLRAPLTGALAAIEARAVAATPDAVTYSYEGLTRGENPRHRFSICNGTWEDEPTRPHRCIAMVYSDSEDSAPDADFYANARRDVFMLLAHVRRLTAALADSDARVASAVAAARDDERERAASVAESHAIDCDLDAEDERTNGTLGGCTVAQDRAKLARMIRDGIRKPACTICEEPATCFGSSEGDPPSYHCDDCCGHGGEDGHCEPVGADAIATTPATGGAQ